ncbi:hypothetical protein QUB30_29740 [Microcoleus sp. BROC3]
MAIELTQPTQLSTQTLSTRSSLKGNLMLKTIKVTTNATGNEQHITKLFKQYVIDFLQKAVAEENNLLRHFQTSDWKWVTDSSPAELVETVSWSWQSRSNADGADGNCTIYLKSDKPIRSQTSEKFVEGNAVYSVDITIIS